MRGLLGGLKVLEKRILLIYMWTSTYPRANLGINFERPLKGFYWHRKTGPATSRVRPGDDVVALGLLSCLLQ